MRMWAALNLPALPAASNDTTAITRPGTRPRHCRYCNRIDLCLPAAIMRTSQRMPWSSNGAADFVQLHGQDALGTEVVLVEGETTYDTGVDKFRPTSEIVDENYYEFSSKTLEEFKKTLETFKKTLIKNKVEKKLNIELKDSYEIEDVIDIAMKLKENHDGVGSVNTCMGKIRSAFRSIRKKKGVMANLLSFAPNDSYGVVLCGGFTVILGALDRAETLQRELYMVLAEIPWQMKTVNDVLEVHKKQTPSLHRSADAVFVAIFSLLTAVINRLSKGLTRKLSGLLLNGKEYAEDVTEAKKELDSKFKEFDREAQACVHRSLARIQETALDTAATVDKIGSTLIGVKEMIMEHNTQTKIHQSQQAAQQTALFQNLLYYFLGSDSMFDPISGALNESQAIIRGHLPLLDAPRPVLNRRPTSPASNHGIYGVDSKSNQKLGKKWLKRSQTSGTDHVKDMRECLNGAEDFSLDDKAQVMTAMQSDDVLAWLRHSESCLLVIEPDSSPDEVVSPVSFVSAMIFKTLQLACKPLVLAVFCALRAEDSTEESVSGPLGFLTQLNAQLVKAIIDRELAIDLSFLKNPRLDNSHEDVKRALKVFKNVLRAIHAAETTDGILYIVIDCLASMSGDEDEVHKAVTDIIGVCEDTGFVLKILVSDPTQKVSEDGMDIDNKVVLSMGSLVVEVDDVDSDDLQQDASMAVEVGLGRPERDERRRKQKSDSNDSSDSSSDSE